MHTKLKRYQVKIHNCVNCFNCIKSNELDKSPGFLFLDQILHPNKSAKLNFLVEQNKEKIDAKQNKLHLIIIENTHFLNNKSYKIVKYLTRAALF